MHQRIPCEVVTLDEYVAKHEITRLDFMKCDVEGAELLVLRGAEHSLSMGLRPILLLEVSEALMRPFGYGPGDLEAFLRRFDYRFYTLTSDGRPQPVESLQSVPAEVSFVAAVTEFTDLR